MEECWHGEELRKKNELIKSLQDELKLQEQKIKELRDSNKRSNADWNVRLSQVLERMERISSELEMYKKNTFLQKMKTGQELIKKYVEPINSQIIDLLSNIRP